MLGVLLASVATAWLLVQRRTIPARRGAEIMRRIRTETLSAYWPDKPLGLWYLRRDGSGKPVSFYGVVRELTGDGFAGETIMLEPDRLLRESWRLSGDAAAGQYRAYAAPPFSAAETSILLHDGRIEVRRGRRPAHQAGASEPDNYIPEGLLHLVIRLVGEGGDKAAFKMIFNEEAIAGGQVQFALATMIPQSNRSVRVKFDSSAGGTTKIYDLDETGRVVRIRDEQDQVIYTLVDLAELIRHFPAVRNLLPKE